MAPYHWSAFGSVGPSRMIQEELRGVWFPPRMVISHPGAHFPHPFCCHIFAVGFLCMLIDVFYVLSLGALCFFLVVLRCWLIHPDLDPCLFLGRQNLAGTFDGRKDAPGAITHQLLISSKFPFS